MHVFNFKAFSYSLFLCVSYKYFSSFCINQAFSRAEHEERKQTTLQFVVHVLNQ